jgi:azurin/lysophospholipase L1-like esterase
MFKNLLTRLTRRSCLLACAILAGQSTANAEFSFNEGDRICLIGNSLAERMQHHGWLETLLQSQLPNKNLVVRNLGFPGDQVDKRPRSKGFMSHGDYLEHCQANVIFAMFGYNEAFRGPEGIEKFTSNLNELIEEYRKLRPNGTNAPRFVLFSPIAHENLNDPNLPDGSKNNVNLGLYSEAIAKVAQAKSITFVDLFAASKEIYSNTSEALTINGVHLNETGNRLIGEAIASALLDKKVQSNDSMANLRDAVVDKNWHWFNRYRATDGNDVWGGRSTLKFVNDQTNFEVLQHELVMLDVMTANRDRHIGGLARGQNIPIDDSNVPAPVEVISNVGGGSRSSSAVKEGSLKYLSGQEGIAKMTIPDGFAVNLFADEEMFPELVNPVQMAVDTKGRLWVAAWATYPKWEPLKKMSDRILILPDEDHDGVADRAITFAEVHNPGAMEFWNGGVLVASQPDVLFLKDTDGDDVADVEIRYVNGIGSSDTHHAANAFVYGPDGGIYWQSGIFLVNHIESPWSAPLNTGASGMYRFDPRQHTIAFHAANSPNPHGISFDHWGYHYANDGTSGNAKQVVPHEKGFKMQELLKKQVRPVPANGVLSSSHFPESMQGDFLILNTIGFLGIKQYGLDRNPDTGDVWGEPKGDLIVSSDKNFRPTDMEFGGDGALYISDWQNVIIGHMQHNVRDPNRDHKHGRVYRMTAIGQPLQKPVPVAGASLSQLLDNLKHPVDGVRYRTRIELSGRDSTEVIAACQEWIKQFDVNKKEDAHHLLEALWLHQQHNVRNTTLLTDLLKSPEPHARIAAGTVQHFWYNLETTQVVLDTQAKPETKVTKSGVMANTADATFVRIGTLLEKMRYDVNEFEVKAGKKIILTFANPDFMPHNIVFVKPKTANEIAMAAMQLGAKGFEKGFVPESDNILAASPLVDHGKETKIEFTAPTEPGEYEYVCTFPGHHILMRGIMKVTK